MYINAHRIENRMSAPYLLVRLRLYGVYSVNVECVQRTAYTSSIDKIISIIAETVKAHNH